MCCSAPAVVQIFFARELFSREWRPYGGEILRGRNFAQHSAPEQSIVVTFGKIQGFVLISPSDTAMPSSHIRRAVRITSKLKPSEA